MEKKSFWLGKTFGDDTAPLWTKCKAGDGKATEYIIQKNPYPNLTLFILDFFVLKLFRPCKFFLDNFLSGFFPCTKELKKPWVLLPVYFIVMPITFVGFLITLPLSGFASVCWYFINKHRFMPYRISYVASASGKTPILKDTYCIGTSNFCLLPEFISRINNLNHLYYRAEAIGKSIASGQLKYQEKYIKNNNMHNNNIINDRVRNRRNLHSLDKLQNIDHVNTMDHSTITEFPEIDILLIQETFDKEAATLLHKNLHKAFPYIVYDVGIDSWKTNYFLSNSGISIASKYPIDEISFRPYSEKMSQCALASKGLLILKVHLGHTNNGKRVVGFVANTHMQAYQGTTQVHYTQLTECSEWLDEFRKNTLEPGEIVAFDVFGGDFNIDNLSPVDKREYCHPVFDKYVDVGRIKAGQDYDWAVGTEMRHVPLHDSQISTPEGLKDALDDPFSLQHYILDGNISKCTIEIASFMPQRDKQGHEILSPVGGKRRIDYVLYRKGDGVVPDSYHAVTQLAGLTDHIPITLIVKTGL